MAGECSQVILRTIRNSLIAGFCGTVVHSLLMLVHSKTGPLPEFQPNDDIRSALWLLTGARIRPVVAWVLLFVNGTLIWGFLFGQHIAFFPATIPFRKVLSLASALGL